jgi:histidinol-phosphate aminotransferase
MPMTIERLHREVLEKILPYVPGKPIEEVERELGISDIVKLASNENPLGPSPLAITAVMEHVRNLHRYPDAAGYYLRQKLSAKLGISPDHLVLGNGSVEVMEQIAETYLNPGEETVVGWPSFFKFMIVTQIMGGVVVKIPMVDKRYDLPAIANAVTPKTRLIFIANPNNPTGTMATAAEVAAFMERIPDRVLVVFDEAYYEYLDRDDYPDTLRYVREGRNVVVTRTFSKIYGLAGMRIGYGIAKPDIIASLNRVRETFNTSSLAQVAALHALDDEEHVAASKSVNNTERAKLSKELTGIGLRPTPSVTNFLLVDMGRNAAGLYESLLREGVIIRPMGMYELPNSMRITIGKKEENDRLLEALAKVL